MEGLKPHFLEELGQVLFGSDLIEVQAVGVLGYDALADGLLLELADALALLADYSQLLVRPPS